VIDADDIQLDECEMTSSNASNTAALPAVSFSDPDEDRTETVSRPGRRNGSYRPAQQQMSWLKCGGYFFLAVGALAGTLAVGYHLGRNNLVPTRSKNGRGSGSYELLHGKDHVTPSDGTTIIAAESVELTLEMIIQEAEDVTDDTPQEYVFPSYIDMSDLSQRDKLLLSTLAKYDFMRDEVVRLVDYDYVDMERSPELHKDSWDFDMLDNALEAMEMYEVDYEPVPVKGHPFMFVGSVGAALNDDSLEKTGITHIVNWSSTAKCNLYPQFTYMCIEGIRNEGQMISQLDKLDMAVDFVHRIHKSGGKVLIHCWYGTKRSLTLVAAYLMKFENMKIEDTTGLISKTRSVGEPYTHALEEYAHQYLERRERV